MDIKKNRKSTDGPALPMASCGRVIVGAKQLRKAVAAGSARLVFLAEDADPAVTQPLQALCAEKNIQLTWVPSMAELGRECGIEVGAAAAAVADQA